jgi:hypothetical protein
MDAARKAYDDIVDLFARGTQPGRPETTDPPPTVSTVFFRFPLGKELRLHSAHFCHQPEGTHLNAWGGEYPLPEAESKIHMITSLTGLVPAPSTAAHSDWKRSPTSA